MARGVHAPSARGSTRVLRPIERLVYRLTGVDETREMRWTDTRPRCSCSASSRCSCSTRCNACRRVLPLNPQGFGAVAPALAFNTAASFTTNTNWQAYGGESTMSYFTQMAGLAYHNFVSAAVGIAVAIAFIRGIAQQEKDTIGNFWVDMVRGAALGAAADLPRRRAVARVAGRGAEPAGLRQSR